MQNPSLNGNGEPVLHHQESLLLRVPNVGLSARSGTTVDLGLGRNVVRCEASSGDLYLSTLRMVFVNDAGWFWGAARGERSFDIPLETLRDEAFHQPIFGASSMTGTSPALDLRHGSPPYEWCLTFNGGVGDFGRLFCQALRDVRFNTPKNSYEMSTYCTPARLSSPFGGLASSPDRDDPELEAAIAASLADTPRAAPSASNTVASSGQATSQGFGQGLFMRLGGDMSSSSKASSRVHGELSALLTDLSDVDEGVERGAAWCSEQGFGSLEEVREAEMTEALVQQMGFKFGKRVIVTKRLAARA